MKNELCVLVGLGCLWAYYSTRPEPAPVSQAPTAVAAAVAPTPRLHYHSPLDAPAMSTSSYSGMGYYSTNEGGFDAGRSTVYLQSQALSLGGYRMDASTGARTSTGASSVSPSHFTMQAAQQAVRHIVTPTSTPRPWPSGGAKSTVPTTVN